VACGPGPAPLLRRCDSEGPGIRSARGSRRLGCRAGPRLQAALVSFLGRIIPGEARTRRGIPCLDASLRRLPALSADQSRHSMWRIGRPQTHSGGLLRWTGQPGPRHLARTHEDPTHCVSQWSGTWRVMPDRPGLHRVDGCPTYRMCACDHVLTLSLGTRKSHNGIQRNVTLLTSRINKRLSAANVSSSSRPKRCVSTPHCSCILSCHDNVSIGSGE
jgi:hypothetical protein